MKGHTCLAQAGYLIIEQYSTVLGITTISKLVGVVS
jgi:hypothetical protein